MQTTSPIPVLPYCLSLKQANDIFFFATVFLYAAFYLPRSVMSLKNEKLEEKKWRRYFMTCSLSYCQTIYIYLELAESWVIYIMYHIHYYMCVCVCVCVCLFCYFSNVQRDYAVCLVTLVMSNSATLWTLACQAPLSLGFFRQEYWSGLPCSTLGDLLDPGFKPAFL